MANEFKIKHGFISTGNGEVQGTLDVSTGININAQPVATRAWVTGTALASYATSQDVTDAINALVDSAPGTLNTLNELAAALGDDASFSTTITNSIATKLPLAGGTMSGDIKILYNDHASGAGYDTQLYIGKSDTLGLQGAFPTYVPAGSYGFFSHASSDGVFFGSVPVSAGASNYYATIAWGDDATEYLQFLYKGSQKAYLTTDGHFYIDGSFYSNGAIVATQAWVSAQSFITGYTETDPVFNASAAAGVTTALIDKWNDAFSWGNHADGGYLAASSYTAADILTKIKTVDGAGSGLDADYIDGLTSSQFLRSDTAGILTYNTSTSETLKFANNTSGGLIQLGFQQNDADGMHHRAYLKAYKSAVGSVAGKFDIVIRSVGGGTTNDIFELEASSKAKWRGENLATETFASDEAAAVQDNLDSLVGSLGTAAYTNSTAYAPASHTHSYLSLGGGTLSGNLNISKDNPILVLNETNAASDAAQIAYISFQDNGTEEAWIGWGSNGNTDFTIRNAIGKVVLNGGGGAYVGTARILTTSDEGAGNGLDADTLDGLQATAFGSAGDTAKGVEAFGWGDHAAAGYLTSYSESDTLATVTARGNTTNGSINVNGDILLTGTATTTNQGRMIDFTGFDKEGTTDFSDRAYIQHTVNTGGHSGSVLVISSQNDSGDGIAFLTNASSKLKHNSNNIATENWVGAQGYLTSLPAHTHPISEIDGLQDELDGKQPAGSYLTSYTETDTLSSVIGRGNTATAAIFTGDASSRVLYLRGTGNIIQFEDAAAVKKWEIVGRQNEFYIYKNDGTGSGMKYYINSSGNHTITGDLSVSGGFSATGYNKSNWDTAYSWGDHAGLYGSAGDTAKGVEAFGWGDHSAAGYITDGNTNWNNTYGFITASSTDTLTNKSGNISQWTNNSGYITASASITGTSAGVVRTVSGTSSAELVRGNMGDNDQARILVGATASNAGYLEIATADDGTEPIYVRQYTGVFSSLTRTATLLDGSGNTSFPGTVTASFSGSLSGNASTASKWSSARTITLGGDLTGNVSIDGSANVTLTAAVVNDSHTHDGRYYTESESDARFVNVTGDTVTGNLAVSGATLSVTSTAAGSEAFYVDGVNGRLFTISDDLSDSLFSVNTISGLPVIEAFADNTVKIGPFSNPVTVDSSGALSIGGVTAATQTYVDNAITGLIGGAPGALDTLNELAAAINDDASYASTITTALGTKAPLASPALTGTPTAPTAAVATNSTQIATTAFVKSQGYLTSLPAHTHPIGEIDGLQAELDGKQPVGSYLTSYTETDTLASVTGRGASTSSKVFFTHNTTADPLSAVEINGGGNHTGLYINPAAAKQAHIRFGTNGTLKWQIRAPFQDSADTALKFYSWVSGDDKFVFNHNGSATFNGGTVWTSANDGAGSGLDADTVDGIQASSFLRSDADDTFTGNLTTANSGWIRYTSNNNTDSNDGKIGAGVFGSGLNIVGSQTTAGTGRQVRIWGSLITDSGATYWHSGNDGAGSGLDADTLDGLQASEFGSAGDTAKGLEAFGWGNHAGLYAAASHTHTFASLTSKPTTLAGYGITDAASSSHNHDSRYMRADTDANTAGAIRINGSYSYGTYTAASNYKTGADNLVLKGNANGVSGIFFESEKDGTNINHPSDFGFIQYSAYGTGTSGESNELVIGVSNDGDDHLVLNAPDVNGLKFRIGASTTDNTVYHSGNLTLATLGYTGATNANYITNNNQLINGAGYITGYTETDTLASVIGRGNLFGTANQGYITANAGTYGSELRKIRRITMTSGSSNWDNDNHCFISTDSAGNLADSLSINSYNDITLRIDTNNNNSASYVRFGQHGTGASTYYFVSGYDGAQYITTITGDVVPGGDRLYNLGQPDNRWRIVFCETLDSAGLHESNLASDTTGFHATGTVLVWKDGEAVPCTTEADHMKIGVAVFGNSSPLVQGAEPVLVSGEVREGDYLITSEVVGHAKAVSRSYVIENQLLDCVIGKALETASGESHLVKTWVTI